MKKTDTTKGGVIALQERILENAQIYPPLGEFNSGWHSIIINP